MKEKSPYKSEAYWDSLLDSAYNEAGVCWPDWPLSYNKWLHIQQQRTFHRLLRKLSISLEGRKVCEVGPGIGFWTEQIRAADVMSYRGFEISEAAAERLSIRFPSFQFECADFGKYTVSPEERESYDFGLSVLVFLHITDNRLFKNCIDNLGKLLSPGAYLFILDAVSVNPLRGYFRDTGDTKHFDERHHNKIRFYRDYVDIYAKAGLSLCDVTPAFTLTQPAYDFRSCISNALASTYYRFFLNPLLRYGGEYLGDCLGKILVRADEILRPYTGKGYSSKWFVFRKGESSQLVSKASNPSSHP